jgi:tetratricopeptide (TPR) repeat protein
MDLKEKGKNRSIDPEIGKLALEFAHGWSEVFRDLSRFQLDLSWPSITTLGMLVDIARSGGKGLTSEMTRGVAAYLAVITTNIWQIFPVTGGRYTVTVKDPGIKITASVTQEGAPRRILYEIELEQAVSTFFNSAHGHITFPPSILDTLPHFSPLRRFAFELFSATSPLGRGVWLDSEDSTRTGRLVSFDLSLAKSTADFCQRVYPSESTLHNPQLYTAGVLTPPASYNEPALLGRSALSLLRNIDTQLNTTDDSEKSAALLTLSLINEPQLSAAALISYVAAHEKAEAAAVARLQRASFFLHPIRSYIKPAIELARASKQRVTFIDLARRNDLNEDEHHQLESILDIEQKLGLLPAPTPDYASLRSVPGLLPPYYLTNSELLDATLNASSGLVLDSPLLILLRCNCELLSGNIGGAKQTLTKGKQLIPTMGREVSEVGAWFFKLMADILYLEGDYLSAFDLYEEAQALCPQTHSELFAELLTNQAASKFNLGESIGAAALIARALELNPNNQEALILRASVTRSAEDIVDGLRKLPFSLSLLKMKVETSTES